MIIIIPVVEILPIDIATPSEHWADVRQGLYRAYLVQMFWGREFDPYLGYELWGFN